MPHSLWLSILFHREAVSLQAELMMKSVVFGKYSDCPDNNISLEIDGKEFHILLRRIGMQKQYYDVTI